MPIVVRPSFNVSDVKVSKLPDDVSLLQQLVSTGHLISTPPQDYDDSYSIAYARSHGGYLVSNDMYRERILNNLKNWFSTNIQYFNN